MFCRNCGKEIPDNTKFCNYCGADQESAPAPAAQPVTAAPAKKPNKNIIIIVAAVLAAALILGGIIFGVTRSGDNEQPAAGKTTVAADDNNGGVVNNTDAPTDTAKPPVDGYVSEYKRYEIKYSDNNYFTIFLRYRENSDYVAEITGAVKIPAGSSEYNSMLADDAIIQQKLKDNGMDNSVANWSSVELTSGLSTSFSFYKLDEGNPNLVAIASEALDLPASGGYFRLSECEQFLLANGFKLVDYSK